MIDQRAKAYHRQVSAATRVLQAAQAMPGRLQERSTRWMIASARTPRHHHLDVPPPGLVSQLNARTDHHGMGRAHQHVQREVSRASEHGGGAKHPLVPGQVEGGPA